MNTWNIGNTTVRNPDRLRDALRLFHNTMSGRSFRKPEQREFQARMIDAGLVDSIRRDGDDGARKFASAFKQLGLVSDWSNGRHWTLTDVGEQLINSPNIESVIFLRQLLKYQIPSPLEHQTTARFNVRPFRLLLKFLLRAHQENLIGLNKYEIGLFVITTLTEDEDEFEIAFSRIQVFRREYNSLNGMVQKSRYVTERLSALAMHLGLRPHTFIDYADSNGRYALMSGLLTLRGNKIAISESRLAFITDLMEDGTSLLSDGDYLTRFYDPSYPPLPSDNLPFLIAETANLLSQINRLATVMGENAIIPPIPPEGSVIEFQNYEQTLRIELRRIREMEFYRNQRSNIALMEIENLLEDIRDNNLVGGQVYAPAYFEWAIWRLFLAINSLVGEVSKTRGFEIDEDMQPVHHAKGGSADLRFIYQDFVLICEMTLTRGSRQFAVEGEPVTRHVFKAIREISDRPVYGLFVAVQIDPNTVDAFHNARYWQDWGSSLPTPVVAINIEHALTLARHLQTEVVTVGELREILDEVLDMQPRFQSGPEWYQAYSDQLFTNFSKSG